MSVRKTAVLAATVASLLVPAVAQADFTKELKAGGAVERKLTTRYHGYNFTASCDQTSRTRFWCTFIGDRASCFKSGHARVRKSTYTGYRVSIASSSTSCF
jgi:hypothetical protein